MYKARGGQNMPRQSILYDPPTLVETSLYIVVPQDMIVSGNKYFGLRTESQKIFVWRYDEKFEIRMSNFLKCVPITLGFMT